MVSLALEREEYWIQNFLDAGAHLTNIRLGNPQARHAGIQEDEESLTAKEACEYLGILRSTLERYAETGRITKYRRGIKREVLFKRAELDRLLEMRPEEVDVMLTNEFFPGGLPSPAFQPHILIECKNWSVKVDSMNVSWFNDKLESRGLVLGILVAAQGITGNTQHLTDAHFIIAKALPKGRRILVITRNDIENLTSATDLVRLLKEKLSDLLLNMTCF